MTGKQILGVIAAVVTVILVSVGVWGAKVALSPVTGQAGAYQEKNSAVNRIAKQERFEDLNAEYERAVLNVYTMQDVYKADPESQIARTNFTGAVSYCRSIAADYNAESRKYTASDFKAIDLPATLDLLACEGKP